MAVQIVEKWQAADGRIFNTELEAVRHEKYIEIGSVFVERESTMTDLVRFYDFILELQKYFAITLHPIPTPNISWDGNYSDESQSFSRYVEVIENSESSYESYIWRFYRLSGNTAELLDTEEETSNNYVEFYMDEPGDYRITLTVVDSNGISGQSVFEFYAPEYVPLPDAPTASFTTDSIWQNAGYPKTITCTNTSTGEVTGRLWTLYRDSAQLSTSSLVSPTFNISEPGNYSISLFVSNAGGSDTTSNVFNITEPLPTFLLDNAPYAIIAAGVRRLKSTYTGPLLRVKRSSDSAEQDFYGTVNDHVDPTALQNWVGAGNYGYVQTLYDQSGNNFHLTASLDGPRIVHVGSILITNGKPSMLFNDNTGLHSDSIPLNIPRAAIVVANSSPDDGKNILSAKTSNDQYGFAITTNAVLAGQGESSDSIFTTDQSFGVSWIRMDSNTSYGGKNQSGSEVNHSIANAFGVINIGNDAGQTNGFSGYASEIIVWQGNDTASSLSSIVSSVMEEYFIASN